MKKELLMIAMLFGAMFGFTACGGDDDANDNGGSSNYQDSRIVNVIPDNYIKELKKHMTIYDGVNPPSIEGSFVMSPTELVYASADPSWDGKDINWADNYFTFSNQSTSARTISVSQTTSNGYSGSGTGAYICGEGNNFTIYFNETGVSYGINFKQAVIITGTKTSAGVRNLTKAFVMVERGQKTGSQDIMQAGEYRIFHDGDGVAEPYTPTSSAKGIAGVAELFPMNAGK